MAAPVLDAVSLFEAAAGSSASPWSWSHTCTGASLLLVVRFDLVNTGQTVNSVSYNGVSLTLKQRDTGAGQYDGSLWYLVAPAAGTHTISATLSGAARGAATGLSYTGVDPTTSFGTLIHTISFATLGSSVASIVSAAGETVIFGIASSHGDAITFTTIDGTQRANHLGSPGDGVGSCRQYVASIAGTGTMSPTWSNTGSNSGDYWASWGVSLKPAAGGPLLFGGAPLDGLGGLRRFNRME